MHIKIASVIFLTILLFHNLVYAYADCIKVERIEITGVLTLSEDEIRPLLDIKIGMPLNRQAVSSSIKRLFLKDIFQDIVVSQQMQDDSNCIVKIEFVERMILDCITVNATLLSPSFVFRNINIQTGLRVNEQEIANSIDHLQSIVWDSGYPNAVVKYQLIPKDKIKAELRIDIDEGEPLVIKDIKLDDPSGILQRFLPFRIGDTFNKLEMQRTERQIRGFIRRNMFLQTPINYSFSDGVLEASFRVGKKINLQIIGNEFISTGSILKEIPLMEIRQINQELVEELTKRIELLYKQKGFTFVQVLPAIEENDTDILLNFFIYEGQRFLIKNIVFQGNSVASDRLQAVMSQRIDTPYNQVMLEDDIESLKEFYSSLGYLDATIEHNKSLFLEDSVEIVISINEGKRYLIDEIHFSGNSIFTSENLMTFLTVKAGDPLNDIEISNSRRNIVDRYRKLGFANVQVGVKKETQMGKNNIHFSINEGERFLFGKTVFRGNVKTRHQVLLREMLHKEGYFFQNSTILQERQRLYRTGLFSDIDLDVSNPYTPFYEGADSIKYVDVVYTVNEAPAGSMEFGVGYGEYERFRGFLEVGYKNLMGMNRQGSIRTEISSIEKRYILSYFDPWFFGENLPLKGLLLHERKVERSIDTKETRYRLKRTTASVGIDRKFTKEVNLEIYYDFSVVNTYDVKPDIIITKEDTGTLIISAIRPGVIYDTRDSPFEPTEGILAGATAKFATSLLLSETDFVKFSFYINKYQSISDSMVLAGSIRGGIARGFKNTQELPLVERFFLGGRTTVRGYEQDTLGPKGSDGNPTGGNVFAMTNLELRTNIGKGLGVVTFLDAGNVWQTTANLSNLKYTTGLGLRYNTPVGPFRIDYGYKLNRDKGDSKGELHFSLGHAF
ncbi:MAG: outer membrane protein assembly factor BamA [Thermodesulfovibrionales bacterium]|nr:outer membrane protein assembly factor BamA [Thermodesulfovibrionales bacterium]